MTVLEVLMGLRELDQFRLVGGTGLSLQLGHRISEDIDLFTDADESSYNFRTIDQKLRDSFKYIDKGTIDDFNLGIMRFVGNTPDQRVKVDLFPTDRFIRDPVGVNSIRTAHIEDIAAMKMETISRGGRKKDFWDVAELLDHYSLDELINIYLEKHPYIKKEEILKGLTDFSNADEYEPPVCMRGRKWDVIKSDIVKAVKEIV